MSQIPDGLHYTKEHEWVEATSNDSVLRVGITDFAQSALGDIVYVQIPKVGESVSEGKVCGEIESTKSVSEIFSPVTGSVTAVNEALVANPEIINSDPYNKGWLLEITVSAPASELMSAAEYATFTA
ncbi:MAG: glycine cleavage system protein GcvH [Actinobacteria bacterium]|nr:glycine cleavage system protein GcvH [Actinomycetota bacterium]